MLSQLVRLIRSRRELSTFLTCALVSFALFALPPDVKDVTGRIVSGIALGPFKRLTTAAADLGRVREENAVLRRLAVELMQERAALVECGHENQRLRELVANVDEQPRGKRARGIGELRSASDMNTTVGKGIRSIPGDEDRRYLDLYLLEKERERLLHEMVAINKRRLRVERRLSNIAREIANKGVKASQQLGSAKMPGRKEEPKGQRWGRLTIEY